MTDTQTIFQDYRRLVAATLGVMLTALLLVLIVQRWFAERNELVANLAAQAAIVGANASTAITLDDERAAKEILTALGNSPFVLEAALYRADGKLVATFTKPTLFGERPLALRAPEIGVSHTWRELQLTTAVWQRRNAIGRITIWASQTAVYEEVAAFLSGLLVTSLAAATLAYLATGGLRQRLAAARGQIEASGALMDQLLTRRDQVLEEEHRRIAVEIHDQIGQVITAAMLNLRLLERRAGAADADAAPLIRDIESQLDAAYKGMKDIATTLHPVVLSFGLTTALEWLGERTLRHAGIKLHIASSDISPALEPREALVLFRIAQEAFNNIVRHAGARNVYVTATSTWEHFALEIADDGTGFDAGAAGAGMSLGLVGIRQRAQSIGALAEIESTPGKGTLVRVTIRRAGAVAAGDAQ